ncbi:ATP-binding cassette domain-containing protein [Dickeya dadantii]|uniref:ATP-binding cassette domain-containing protein n=1 Tax=Dickeya dadantii TaxID=204038 RepID=UPI003F528902
MRDQPIIRIQQVSQRFSTASGSFVALDNVSFDIHTGETLSLIGHSGCGKSTLLNLIAGLTLRPAAACCATTAKSTARGRSGRWYSRTIRCCRGSPPTTTWRWR